MLSHCQDLHQQSVRTPWKMQKHKQGMEAFLGGGSNKPRHLPRKKCPQIHKATPRLMGCPGLSPQSGENPKWNPGKCNSRLKPAVFRRLSFAPISAQNHQKAWPMSPGSDQVQEQRRILFRAPPRAWCTSACRDPQTSAGCKYIYIYIYIYMRHLHSREGASWGLESENHQRTSGWLNEAS